MSDTSAIEFSGPCPQCGLRWAGAWTDCPGCIAQATALAISEQAQELATLRPTLPDGGALDDTVEAGYRFIKSEAERTASKPTLGPFWAACLIEADSLIAAHRLEQARRAVQPLVERALRAEHIPADLWNTTFKSALPDGRARPPLDLEPIKAAPRGSPTLQEVESWDRPALVCYIKQLWAEVESLRAESEHWHAHYDAALANWKEVLTEVESLRAAQAESGTKSELIKARNGLRDVIVKLRGGHSAVVDDADLALAALDIAIGGVGLTTTTALSQAAQAEKEKS